MSSSALPSRASFQLPPVDAAETGGAVAMDTPVETEAVPRGGRPPGGWADDDPGERKVGMFSTVGLIGIAVLLMTAVYFGATVLMKQ